MRECLRSKHLGLASDLARNWERAGDDEQAAKCYEQALEVDHVAEDLYKNLMACYQRLGDQAKAVQTYERCRKMLAAELGIIPSPKTETLYAFLSNADSR